METTCRLRTGSQRSVVLKAEIAGKDEKIKKLEDELAELKDESNGLHGRESGNGRDGERSKSA